MVVRFTDPLLMAQRQGVTGESAPAPSLADGVARALQEVADRHGIGYLRLLADQVVAASGFAREEAGEPAAFRIAAAALEARGRCAKLFEAAEMPMEFCIGVDLGVAIGNAVGHAQVFNLWGDAVRTADQMALSAPPGAIQVADAAYAALRQDFLFRPRGSFWLPRVGEMRTYVLAGVLAGRP
jgi:class 3 adenylate cyclase